MMDRSFDFLIAGISLIAGIMLVTGHGDVFMKGGNAEVRKKIYDEKKLAKASGIALILTGIATLIDSYTTSVLAEVIYIASLVVIFGGLALYMRYKCRLK